MNEELFDYTGLTVQLALRHKNKKDLNTDLGISWDTIAKLGKGYSVNMHILFQICTYLSCDICDIVQIKKDQDKS